MLTENQDTERNLSLFLCRRFGDSFFFIFIFTGIWWYISAIIQILFHNPDHPLKGVFLCIFSMFSIKIPLIRWKHPWTNTLGTWFFHSGNRASAEPVQSLRSSLSVTFITKLLLVSSWFKSIFFSDLYIMLTFHVLRENCGCSNLHFHSYTQPAFSLSDRIICNPCELTIISFLLFASIVQEYFFVIIADVSCKFAGIALFFVAESGLYTKLRFKIFRSWAVSISQRFQPGHHNYHSDLRR